MKRVILERWHAVQKTQIHYERNKNKLNSNKLNGTNNISSNYDRNEINQNNIINNEIDLDTVVNNKIDQDTVFNNKINRNNIVNEVNQHEIVKNGINQAPRISHERSLKNDNNNGEIVTVINEYNKKPTFNYGSSTNNDSSNDEKIIIVEINLVPSTIREKSPENERNNCSISVDVVEVNHKPSISYDNGANKDTSGDIQVSNDFHTVNDDVNPSTCSESNSRSSTDTVYVDIDGSESETNLFEDQSGPDKSKDENVEIDETPSDSNGAVFSDLTCSNDLEGKVDVEENSSVSENVNSFKDNNSDSNDSAYFSLNFDSNTNSNCTSPCSRSHSADLSGAKVAKIRYKRRPISANLPRLENTPQVKSVNENSTSQAAEESSKFSNSNRQNSQYSETSVNKYNNTSQINTIKCNFFNSANDEEALNTNDYARNINFMIDVDEPTSKATRNLDVNKNDVSDNTIEPAGNNSINLLSSGIVGKITQDVSISETSARSIEVNNVSSDMSFTCSSDDDSNGLVNNKIYCAINKKAQDPQIKGKVNEDATASGDSTRTLCSANTSNKKASGPRITDKLNQGACTSETSTKSSNINESSSDIHIDSSLDDVSESVGNTRVPLRRKRCRAKVKPDDNNSEGSGDHRLTPRRSSRVIRARRKIFDYNDYCHFSEAKRVGTKRKYGTGESTSTSEDKTSSGKPIFCYCRREELGTMIACDNKCKNKWFHYKCVGINIAPLGKWYCKDCMPLKKFRAKKFKKKSDDPN